MKSKIVLSTGLLILLFVTVESIDAQQLYESPRLTSAKFNHKSMAILPVYVTNKDNSNQATKGIVQEDQMEGYNLQRSFYSYFITRKPKNVNWTVEIQEYEETNRRIEEAGILYTDLLQTPKDELAAILQVDAIYICEVKKFKSISDAAAVALDIFVGYGGYNGNIDIATSIFEGSSGELMWKYERQLSTSYWGRSDYLVDNIMKLNIKKFPYKEKKKK